MPRIPMKDPNPDWVPRWLGDALNQMAVSPAGTVINGPSGAIKAALMRKMRSPNEVRNIARAPGMTASVPDQALAPARPTALQVVTAADKLKYGDVAEGIAESVTKMASRIKTPEGLRRAVAGMGYDDWTRARAMEAANDSAFMKQLESLLTVEKSWKPR